MTGENVPFVIGNAKALMRGFHVAAEISGRAAERHAKEFPHQLVILAHAVTALALPVDANRWIPGEARHEIRDEGRDDVMASKALIEQQCIRVWHWFLLS